MFLFAVILWHDISTVFIEILLLNDHHANAVVDKNAPLHAAVMCEDKSRN